MLISGLASISTSPRRHNPRIVTPSNTNMECYIDINALMEATVVRKILKLESVMILSKEPFPPK